MISNGSNVSPLVYNSPYMCNVSGSMTSFVYDVPASCAVYHVRVQAVTLAGLGTASCADQAIFVRGIVYMLNIQICIRHILEYFLYINFTHFLAPKKLEPGDIVIEVSHTQDKSQSMTVKATFVSV